MRRFVHDNGLSLCLGALFLASFIGQALTGWRSLNEELAQHAEPALSLGAYVLSGHFQSSLFENWESEFLQMAIYVVLTGLLVQKGSPESKEPQGGETSPLTADSPWPARRGGWVKKLYAHSLSLVLALLFALSFWLHLDGSTRQANEEALRHGRPPTTIAEHLGSAEFWFESFQNWQSEFLSVAVLVVLGIWLRERDSPESKPVEAPHHLTGR